MFYRHHSSDKLRTSGVVFLFVTLIALPLIAISTAEGEPVIHPENLEDRELKTSYYLQGEYRGKIDGKPAGIQVAHVTGDRFNGFLFEGGLPGEEIDGVRSLGRGNRRQNRLQFESGKRKFVVSDRAIEVTGEDGNRVGRLKRVRRKSKTLQKTPPEDAIVLFDGTSSSLDNWENGERSEHGYLKEGTNTKRTFQDFVLHMEFRLPYKPSQALSHQSRGNSGVYVFNNYEIQLLETYGLPYMNYFAKNWKEHFRDHFGFSPKSGRSRWGGSLYSFKAADVNMMYPPLSWQTYDIKFTAPRFDDGKKVQNARITVWHNGVKTHDDRKLGRGTGAGKGREEVAEGKIYFQDHGNPVRFRHIWIKEK